MPYGILRKPDTKNEATVKTSAFSSSSALFSRASDEWSTPDDLYTALDDEFHFTFDAAATAENTKSPTFLDRDRDALIEPWSFIPTHRSTLPSVWMNPPYSRVHRFMTKATEEARLGCTVVCLVPSRTDTKWWHESVWDAATHKPRPGVEIRFLRGRLKFGNGKGSAPFPSALIILRPPPRDHSRLQSHWGPE
jgi:phage N-6-adenine-methyltransferase